MHLSHLALADFRSYRTVDVALTPGVTTFVGRNGQGKTNLVEAAMYLATLSSHRTGTDAALVRSGAERALIRAQVVRDDRSVVLETEIAPGRANRARINRGKPTRARELLGWLRAVLFAPEDLVLVKGDPDARRRYLDELLTTLTPRFAGVRADYDRVLRQRSALLRSAGVARSARDNALATLAVWDEQLVALGSELTAARMGLVHDLAPLLAAAYAEIAPETGDPVLAYKSSSTDGHEVPAGELEAVDHTAVAQQLRQALDRVRDREFDRGVCLVGPHRDDLVVSLGGLAARGYASHGESWSLALGLRLAAHDLLSADGDIPVLVLDDVFAELDAGRRAALARRVESSEQVLITAAVEEDVPVDLRGSVFRVSLGEVTRA